MQLRYDDDFVEAGVFIIASGKRAGVPPPQRHRFHFERERCYDVRDPDEREAAFARLHLGWFREWGLENLLLDVITKYPLLNDKLAALAFRRARTRKDEAAELYVSADGRRSGVVAMGPGRFERDEAVRDFLPHELMHLSDMIDPAFAYTPDLRAQGANSSNQRLVRERYRLLWDITIDGRLGRPIPGQGHRAVFNQAFDFWPHPQREEVFSRLWTARSPRHEELLALASDPRGSGEARQPTPGGTCPLCGFCTFEWADASTLDPATCATIEGEFPHWSVARGLCGRCAEMYAVGQRFANALPQ